MDRTSGARLSRSQDREQIQVVEGFSGSEDLLNVGDPGGVAGMVENYEEENTYEREEI